eukprot:883053-Rhodomonas_salina.6
MLSAPSRNQTPDVIFQVPDVCFARPGVASLIAQGTYDGVAPDMRLLESGTDRVSMSGPVEAASRESAQVNCFPPQDLRLS